MFVHLVHLSQQSRKTIHIPHDTIYIYIYTHLMCCSSYYIYGIYIYIFFFYTSYKHVASLIGKPRKNWEKLGKVRKS